MKVAMLEALLELQMVAMTVVLMVTTLA